MQQSRYNIFNLIHKALRSLLYETATLIQQKDFNNRDEAIVVINRLEKVLYYFDKHAEHEDNFILPAIERYAKDLVDAFENEHVVDHALAQSLRMAIDSWKQTEDAVEMIELGRSIFYDFNAFIAFNLTHMNKEEDLLNAVLWKYYTDLELMQITQALISTIPPEDLFDQSRRMMISINKEELITWLTGIKLKAPQEIFTLHMKMAEDVLPEKRWQELNAGLRHGLVQA